MCCISKYESFCGFYGDVLYISFSNKFLILFEILVIEGYRVCKLGVGRVVWRMVLLVG